MTAATLISDVNAINTGVNDFRADLAKYDGSPISQTPLLADFAKIETANRKGYADANLATPFSKSDSKAIVQDVIETVGKTIPASIRELKAKKPLFQASGGDSVVVAQLKVLLYDHDTFSAAVSAKLTADLAAGARVVAKIHDVIQSGIDYYST